MKKSTIQSVVYDYPTIKVIYNCPMNFHSAKLMIIAQINPDGELKNLVFEGDFLHLMVLGELEENRICSDMS
ncbi:MAG: hypothetical protein HWD61_12840 [Parachlamydiaceae bacterium]|nr:MAG: hypothetical protein HWD61_12840 [Parachlamydiaceae bacterium]